MNRRDALSLLSGAAAGILAVPSLLLSGCRNDTGTYAYAFFTPEEITLLEQVAETILPATPDSPGAKEAQVGAFMDVFVADCLDPEDGNLLRRGLQQLDQRCREQEGQPFLRLSAARQHDLLVALDMEAEAYQEALQPGESPHYFRLLKGLALLGYFTSEPGATQGLRYVPVPGKYEGDIPYVQGEKAWAI